MASPKSGDEAQKVVNNKVPQEGSTSPKNAAWEDQQRVRLPTLSPLFR
jgi:hypothetical protein